MKARSKLDKEKGIKLNNPRIKVPSQIGLSQITISLFCVNYDRKKFYTIANGVNFKNILYV